MITNIIEPIGIMMVKGNESDFIKVENYEEWLSQGWSPKTILWGSPGVEDDGVNDGLSCCVWRVPDCLREVAEKQHRGELL